MGDEDLTPANYILKIKSMSGAERRGITAKKLIELIVATPSPDERQINIDTQLAQLQNTMNLISNIATANQAEITTLKNEKETLANEIKELKEKDAGDDNDNDVTEMKKEIDELRSQINEIDQYLRVNNLEFVGLPPPNDGETEETVIINACNSLEGIDIVIHPEDIDISHPLPSKRRDGKPVHVARFISRKVKFAILSAKKSEVNRQFKFRDQDVFINEHLSKTNRGLFASAIEKKQALGYKFLWTKGGVVNMRKTENSQVIVISKESDLLQVV